MAKLIPSVLEQVQAEIEKLIAIIIIELI